MRHMLITIPVAILLSMVACGDQGTQEGTTGMGGEPMGTTEGTTAQGEINIDENLGQALEQDDPNTFVREANDALDQAETHLNSLGAQADQDRRTQLEQDINEARQNLQQLSGQTSGDWKQQGREVERSIQDIERNLNQMAG